MTQRTDSQTPLLPVLLVAGWLLPGLGHWLMGEKKRGGILAVSLIGLFIAGLLIGSIHVVNRRSEPLWYAGQALAGPIAILAGEIYLRLDPNNAVKPPGAPGLQPPVYHSIGRVNELGTLYCTLAGALNLLAILDLIARAVPGSPAARRGSSHPPPPSLQGRIATRE
jgi:hypothetical protein